MRTLLSLFAFLFTVSGVIAAPRDKPPNFDIQRNCSSEASDSGGEQTKARCLQAEDNAKKQLEQRWSTLKPSELTRQCLQESSIGGDQSYVELMICLDMSNAWPSDQTTVGQDPSKGR